MSRIIDLHAPEGNVFCIAGLAISWNRQIGTIETMARKDIMRATTDRLDGKPGEFTDVLDTFDEWFKGKIGYTFRNDPRADDYGDDEED